MDNRNGTRTPQRHRMFDGIVLLGVAAICLLGGAFVAYMWAVGSVKADNVFMSGDQSVAANYAPAIVLAVAGAFVLLLAVIASNGRRP